MDVHGVGRTRVFSALEHRFVQTGGNETFNILDTYTLIDTD